MHSESFTIKVNNFVTIRNDAPGSVNEITIRVLTQSNVVIPGVPASYPFKCIEYGEQNYNTLKALLDDLINRNLLSYAKQEGNRHKFLVHLSNTPGHVREEWVDIEPNEQGVGRNLEDMLLAVCRMHNISVPYFMQPKSLLVAAWDRYQRPWTPDEELRNNLATAGVAAVTAAVCLFKLRP